MELNIELRIQANNMEVLQEWINFITKQKEPNLHCTLNVVVEEINTQFKLSEKSNLPIDKLAKYISTTIENINPQVVL